MFALALSNDKTRRQTIPNLLPCAIHHNGPVSTSSRYWSPILTTSAEANGITKSQPKTKTKTSYFRGRKLAGRTVNFPANYTGLVLQKTSDLLPMKPKIPTAEGLRAMEEGSDDGFGAGEGREEGEAEVKMLEVKAEFEELVVWGHEVVPEGDDVYVKGVEEWVGFAEAVGTSYYQLRSVGDGAGSADGCTDALR